jgi:hypothetical protein
MNGFDRENLDWLKTCEQEEFDEWVAEADIEDINYAINLFKLCRQELMEQELAILDRVEDTSKAIDVLKKFTLKG